MDAAVGIDGSFDAIRSIRGVDENLRHSFFGAVTCPIRRLTANDHFAFCAFGGTLLLQRIHHVMSAVVTDDSLNEASSFRGAKKDFRASLFGGRLLAIRCAAANLSIFRGTLLLQEEPLPLNALPFVLACDQLVDRYAIRLRLGQDT